ncbi:hypothetical protein GLS40_13625 [Pseudooceanicola sp. 216_PA32_1]|uniref:Uncharacterized protein n=1 Tax=Pseudooceanicola pacificus TaxID=2676438 RepID=A0A844W8C3_9RHOB|nr:hypothetical protein [Pseudooceanicola pacificus]MWB79074.1 hypothetical protein [Pseudooceanicola pacificus]
MTTTEPPADAPRPAKASNTWREIVQSGAVCARIEGVSLEFLIDFQRDRLCIAGEGR